MKRSMKAGGKEDDDGGKEDEGWWKGVWPLKRRMKACRSNFGQ